MSDKYISSNYYVAKKMLPPWHRLYANSEDLVSWTDLEISSQRGKYPYEDHYAFGGRYFDVTATTDSDQWVARERILFGYSSRCQYAPWIRRYSTTISNVTYDLSYRDVVNSSSGQQALVSETIPGVTKSTIDLSTPDIVVSAPSYNSKLETSLVVNRDSLTVNGRTYSNIIAKNILFALVGFGGTAHSSTSAGGAGACLFGIMNLCANNYPATLYLKLQPAYTNSYNQYQDGEAAIYDADESTALVKCYNGTNATGSMVGQGGEVYTKGTSTILSANDKVYRSSRKGKATTSTTGITIYPLIAITGGSSDNTSCTAYGNGGTTTTSATGFLGPRPYDSASSNFTFTHTLTSRGPTSKAPISGGEGLGGTSYGRGGAFSETGGIKYNPCCAALLMWYL